MRAPVITLALAALTATGCGSSGHAAPPPAAAPSAPGASAPSGPKGKAEPTPLAFAQPGIVLGDQGARLRITPLGVLYSKGPYPRLPGADPQNGWYVAIALRVEALDTADKIPAPISGGGLEWYGNQQIETIMSGNGTGYPWIGRVTAIDSTPVQPDMPVTGILTFDIPFKGGQLVYRFADAATVVRWNLPTSDQGTGLEQVHKLLAGLASGAGLP